MTNENKEIENAETFEDAAAIWGKRNGDFLCVVCDGDFEVSGYVFARLDSIDGSLNLKNDFQPCHRDCLDDFYQKETTSILAIELKSVLADTPTVN